MLVSLPAGALHDVVGEQLKLKRLLRNNAVLWTELATQAAKHASANGFDECWGPLRDEFPTLRLFACGLAAVFRKHCFQEARHLESAASSEDRLSHVL
jgi:hypothetical protein